MNPSALTRVVVQVVRIRPLAVLVHEPVIGVVTVVIEPRAQADYVAAPEAALLRHALDIGGRQREKLRAVQEALLLESWGKLGQF